MAKNVYLGVSGLKCDRERIALIATLKRAIWVICKNDRFAWKICIFCMCLTDFTLFYAHAKLLTSLFAHSLFLKNKLSNLLPSLFTKEWMWAFHLRRFLEKSASTLCSKKGANFTFAYKKQAIC